MRKTLIAGDLKLGVVGLGCMSMSHGYSPSERDDEESITVIHRAIELGITLFDTADIYGPYSNERLLGTALRGRREKAVIATKCGLIPLPGGKLTRNGRPEFIRSACENSLARLQTDVIDIYQLHRVDPEVPIEETWGAMAELVSEGKVRDLGISHATIEQLDRIHSVYPVAAVQYELSLWSPFTRDDVLPWCRENDVNFLAFSPIGRGYLAGTLPGDPFGDDDSRSRDPRFSIEAMRTNRVIVKGLQEIADRLGATPAQVSIAWVLAQDERVVPIPGTKKLRWLEENAAAAELKLSQEDLRDIEALPAPMGEMRWT